LCFQQNDSQACMLAVCRALFSVQRPPGISMQDLRLWFLHVVCTYSCTSWRDWRPMLHWRFLTATWNTRRPSLFWRWSRTRRRQIWKVGWTMRVEVLAWESLPSPHITTVIVHERKLVGCFGKSADGHFGISSVPHISNLFYPRRIYAPTAENSEDTRHCIGHCPVALEYKNRVGDFRRPQRSGNV